MAIGNYITLEAQEIAIYFLIIIAVILLVGLYYRLIKKETNKIIALLPNIEVTLGILGTFVGIYIGLLEFDVQDISKSIPALLEGLKTAFITSIAGISASIILRFAFEGKSVQEEKKSEVREEDPIDLLKAIVAGINNLERSSREIEKSIVACFRSDEEYSLISQLKLIRQEIMDTRREIITNFKEFADKIAKSSTDALVEALKKVIDDFNILLNELVSESFKELSSAMVKLTEWQENYRTHVDEMQGNINTLITHMKETVKIFETSSETLSKIDNNLESIDSSLSGLSVSAADITQHIESLKLQNETLKESMLSIKQIGEDAKSVLPNITEHIDNLTTRLENSVLNVTEKFDETSTIMGEFVDKSIKDIQGAVDNHSESIQKSIENIDKGLNEELSKALNILAGSLAALSAKFAEDYLPLTE
ncbi:MAG: MotA/TolQ/ExbB proton channel family protein, partial [Candidatus Dadabacteria bacterium]|nr:MotA/TolQ/ExbB proton channel family protein [Candidatus Dadabacteria bacterium]